MVGSGYHHTKSCLASWNSGKTQRHGEYTFLEEMTAEFLGQRSFAEHDGGDGCRALPGIETERTHFLLEITGVFPEPIHEFCGLL